jgi:hypothetical protein
MSPKKEGTYMKAKFLFTSLIAALLLVTACNNQPVKTQSTKLQSIKKTTVKEPRIVSAMIKKKDPHNFFVVTTADGNGLYYAYYVYKDNKVLKKFPYKPNAYFGYTAEKPGTYKVKVFVKDNTGKKVSIVTKPISISK